MRKIITQFGVYITLIMSSITVQSQVGIGTTTVDPSAELEILSTDQGVLVPRMLEAEKNAIAAPAKGLLVYQTNGAAGFWYFDGTIWTNFGGGSAGWAITGDAGTTPATNFIGTIDAVDFVVKTNSAESFRIDANSNVGVGTTTPRALVDIEGPGPIFKYTDGSQAIGYVLQSDAFGNAFWAPDNAVITSDDDWYFRIGSTNADPIYHIGQVVIGKNVFATPGTVELDIDNGLASGTQIGIGDFYFEDGLNVTYTSNDFLSSFAGNLGFNNTTTGGIHRWNNVYGFAAVVNTSDGNLKKNIQNLDYGIKEVMNMKPISYYWKEEINGKYDQNSPKELKLGFSAQELEKIIPEAVVSQVKVRSIENGPFDKKMDTQYKGVRYEYLIPVLVNAQKEQQAEIIELIAKNKALKNKLNNK